MTAPAPPAAPDAAGWPDPARPGVPLHPERDGWHWLLRKGDSKPVPWCWTDDQAAEGDFGWDTDDDLDTPDEMARYFDYAGPCVLPSDLAAERAAAWGAGRDAAVAVATDCRDAWKTGHGQGGGVAYAETIAAITRTLSPPASDADALAAVVARAKAEEREKVARWLDQMMLMHEGPELAAVLRRPRARSGGSGDAA
jgi:hypothetical protein